MGALNKSLTLHIETRFFAPFLPLVTKGSNSLDNQHEKLSCRGLIKQSSSNLLKIYINRGKIEQPWCKRLWSMQWTLKTHIIFAFLMNLDRRKNSFTNTLYPPPDCSLWGQKKASPKLVNHEPWGLSCKQLQAQSQSENLRCLQRCY